MTETIAASAAVTQGTAPPVNRSDDRKVIRAKRSGTVVIKPAGGFPLNAKLYDISIQSVRSHVEMPVALGKEYQIDVQVFQKGKHYTFSCLSKCIACTLSGRGFLIECQYKNKSGEVEATISDIINRD